MKSSENHRFYEDFRWNKVIKLTLNSVNTRSKFWRKSHVRYPHSYELLKKLKKQFRKTQWNLMFGDLLVSVWKHKSYLEKESPYERRKERQIILIHSLVILFV